MIKLDMGKKKTDIEKWHKEYHKKFLDISAI
jgi:hypothetical protein